MSTHSADRMSNWLRDPNEMIERYQLLRRENVEVLKGWPEVRNGTTVAFSKAWYLQETNKMLKKVDKHIKENPTSEGTVVDYTKAINQWDEAKRNFRIRGGTGTRDRKDVRLFYDINEAIKMLRDLRRYSLHGKNHTGYPQKMCHVSEVNADDSMGAKRDFICSVINESLYDERQPNPDTVTYLVVNHSKEESLLLRLVNPKYEEEARTEMEVFTGGRLQDRLVVDERAYEDGKELENHMEEFKKFLPSDLRSAMCDVLARELADLASQASALTTQSGSSSAIVESRAWLPSLMSGIEQCLRKEPSMQFVSV